jgi:ligand-binding sensor domain-containing protein
MKARVLVILLLYVLCGAGLITAGNEIFFRKLGNPKDAYGDEVHQILIDRDGYAWIITTDRLLRFDGKEMKRYGDMKVNRMATDSAGRLYASGPNIMSRYNRLTDMFDKLPQLREALNDNNGNFWLLDAAGDSCLVNGVSVRACGSPAHARRAIFLHP